MKKLLTICLIIVLTGLINGCASNNGYSKTPPPCDSFVASFIGKNPCGPKRPVNWY